MNLRFVKVSGVVSPPSAFPPIYPSATIASQNFSILPTAAIGIPISTAQIVDRATR